MIAATLAIGSIAVVMLVVQLIEAYNRFGEIEFWADFIIYRDAAERWLSSGGFYLASQLTAPYPVVPPVVLYPPTMLVLFVPFVFLPAILWWLIPIGITAWAVARHHPRPIAIAAMLFCMANPTTLSTLVWGNPAMWIVASLALGTHFGWQSVFVFMKPPLFPFALVGMWRRAWWVALLGLCAVSLVFLPMWFDYIKVLQNARGEAGWFGYSTAQFPLMLLPLVAWLGGRYPPNAFRQTERPG